MTVFVTAPAFTGHTVPELLSGKQKEFYDLAFNEKAGSSIAIPVLEPTNAGLSRNMPGAFFITLFRPLPWESHNVLMMMSALENVLIMTLIIISVYFFFMGTKNQTTIPPIIYFSVFFVIITFCLVGLVTPILGALVRYKVPSLPFLIILLFYHPWWGKINSRIVSITSKMNK